MYVDPFKLGIAVGVIATLGVEIALIITYAVLDSRKSKWQKCEGGITDE